MQRRRRQQGKCYLTALRCKVDGNRLTDIKPTGIAEQDRRNQQRYVNVHDGKTQDADCYSDWRKSWRGYSAIKSVVLPVTSKRGSISTGLRMNQSRRHLLQTYS